MNQDESRSGWLSRESPLVRGTSLPPCALQSSHNKPH